MSDRPTRDYSARSCDAGTNSLSVGDLQRFLLAIARVCDNPMTGNLPISRGLRILAKALKPHSARSIEDLPTSLDRAATKSTTTRRSPKQRLSLPDNLQGITYEQVESILRDDRYLKLQLIKLGSIRFHIPRAKLSALSREKAMHAIFAAMDSEKSLEAISREARRSGDKRAGTLGDRTMDWVGMKSYENGAFALGKILDRFEADVAKANDLPENIRAGRTFRVVRDGDHSAVVERDSGTNGIRSMLTLWVAEGETVHCRGGPETIGAPIRPVPQEDTGKVKWRIGDSEPVSLWQLSRTLLGRYVFEF